MKIPIKLSLFVCAFFVFAVSVSAQRRDAQTERSSASNPAMIIVSSAAKGTWAVTAFTAKTVAKPFAKAVLLKVTPAVSKFVLKNAAKEALPLMVKLSVL